MTKPTMASPVSSAINWLAADNMRATARWDKTRLGTIPREIMAIPRKRFLICSTSACTSLMNSGSSAVRMINVSGGVARAYSL